jgi:hypothetical protein
VLAQAQALERGNRIGCKDVTRMPSRKQRQQNCDEPAHNVRIAVAYKLQHRSPGAVGSHFCGKPNLACATLNLVDTRAVTFGKRRERLPELDEIAIAVVPLIKQGKIVYDLINHHAALWASPPTRLKWQLLDPNLDIG